MKNYISILRTSLLAAVALTAFSADALSWGQKGHDTVCQIAENHLTCRAKKQIAAILDGQSLVYWANWLDNASHTGEYAYTKTWHYLDINPEESFDSMEREPKGDVLTAMESQIAVLKDKNAGKDEKALALKILIHVTGDLHCPMHVGHKSDLGGNKHQVRFFNAGKNLHSVFDAEILESGHKWSHQEYAAEVDRDLRGRKLRCTDYKEITAGTPTDWLLETKRITDGIYDSTPIGAKLGYDYVAEWTPVLEKQLLRGGLRLASILNGIF